jgi:peptidoglycan lytic transglycosylase
MKRHHQLATLAAVIATAVPAPAQAQRPTHAKTRRVGSHISLHVSRHNLVRGQRFVARGRIRPRGSHRVKLVVRGPDGTSRALRSGRGGTFALHLRARRLGSHSIRAYGVHDRRISASASAVRRVTTFRPAAASYYGPGLYGGALACGGTLQPGTLGVAHKTLPCGSQVKLRYRGRNVTVRVVDRGPYVAGRDFDLTAATKARLGFPDTGVLLSSR